MRKKVIIGCWVALVVFSGLFIFWNPLMARFGGPEVRQAILNNWVNQHTRLNFAQRSVSIDLLYKDVGDPNAVSEALTVLNAHLHEREDAVVRHLAFVALTTTNISDCRVALSGLLKVSSRNQKLAAATFLYQLKHIEPNPPENALALAACISGLAKFSYQEATPEIAHLTNSSSQYLALTAQEALIALEK